MKIKQNKNEIRNFKTSTWYADNELYQKKSVMHNNKKNMNIWEAIKKAMEEDKYITLPEFCGFCKIQPTDTNRHCIVMGNDGSNPSRYGWQPSARDLMREDWILVD